MVLEQEAQEKKFCPKWVEQKHSKEKTVWVIKIGELELPMEREWDWKGVLGYNCDSHMIWLWLTEQ